MAAPKKMPQRHCMGCNAERQKNELIRVVRTPDGSVIIDKTGKAAGRGAYICPELKCLTTAKKSGRLGRSLGVIISDGIYAELESQIKNDR